MLTGNFHFTKRVYPLRAMFTVISKYICICFDIFLLQNRILQMIFCDKGTKVNPGFAFRV